MTPCDVIARYGACARTNTARPAPRRGGLRIVHNGLSDIGGQRQPILVVALPARSIRAWGTQWLRAIGSTDPESECAAILDYLDGLIFHQLTFPGPADQQQPQRPEQADAAAP